MIRSLHTAASGMEAQQHRIDVIANNLANTNTVGFKKARAEFADLFYQQVRAASASATTGAGRPAPLEVGQGVRILDTQKIFQTGDMLQTGNPLDLAIEGDGFFTVLMPDGTTAYTRAGNFRTNEDGTVVNAEGLPLDPPLSLPPGAQDVTVEADGRVLARVPGDEQAHEIGRIELATFVNPAGLRSLGRGLFVQTDASGEPTLARPGEDGAGRIAQGMLEGSNVKVVEEMIDLISAQRAYEINSRVVKAADEMLREANNVR